ncbi:MAG: prepilin-type N-terminal cleavage/methylation domain-containing protein [Pirellulales bacterium]
MFRQADAVVRTSVRGAFTLLEVLIALTITLILMGLVMEMFSKVGDGVNSARANMDLHDQLRNAKQRLISDLRGTTAPTVPPLDPNMHLGYFEYVEGPRVASSQFAGSSTGGDIGEQVGNGDWYTRRGVASNIVVNSVIGDTDDILMFTTSSYDDKFVGRAGVKAGVTLSAKSRVAEVAWFLRRRTQSEFRSMKNDQRPEFYTLHRRVFLVLPNGIAFGSLDNVNTDYSLRPIGGTVDNTAMPRNLVALNNAIAPQMRRNSLGDLTMRENRSLHQPFLWPYQMMYVSPSFYGSVDSHGMYNPGPAPVTVPGGAAYAFDVPIQILSLPTLSEHSMAVVNNSMAHPQRESGTGNYVMKMTVTPTVNVGYVAGNQNSFALGTGSRVGSDVVMTNVVGFDVKAWDPGAPIFRAPASTQNPNNAGVLIPGDASFAQALNLFNTTPGAVERQPVAFGAFADLNYMGLDQPDCAVRYNAYQDTETTALSALCAWSRELRSIIVAIYRRPNLRIPATVRSRRFRLRALPVRRFGILGPRTSSTTASTTTMTG